MSLVQCAVLAGKMTFLVGNRKSAGKTTFLNYALQQLRPRVESLAFLSIGLDGERQDQLHGSLKPGIYARRGDYLLTAETALARSDMRCIILDILPESGPLGRLLLCRVERDGWIELINPGNNTRLSEALNILQKGLQVSTILLDGAVNRVTQVASSQEALLVPIIRIEPAEWNKSIEFLQKLALLSNIPSIQSAPEGCEPFFLSGALTPEKYQQLFEDLPALLLEDFSKVFLSVRELQALMGKKEMYFRHIYKIPFYVINLFNISEEAFFAELEKRQIDVPVMLNPYRMVPA